MDQLSRRTFIRTVAAAGGVLAAGALLQACGGTASTSSPGAAASSPAAAKPASAKPASAAASGAVSASAKPAASAAASVASGGKPEKASLKVGLPSVATTFLPLYLSAANTAKAEGLSVEIVNFQGDGPLVQALASGSIDISLGSPNGMINAVTAGQPVIGFFAGFYQPIFSWISVPAVKTWEDLKGKQLGVTTPGSLTDTLSRYVLQKHNLEPGKDVNLINGGGPAAEMQAMKANRLACAITIPPFTWESTDGGMNVLGTQAKEVAPQWPTHIYGVKKQFMESNPNTMVAFLRAHVSALRLAKAQPKLATDELVKQLKFDPKYGQRAYEDVMPGFNERGPLPEAAMPIFWKVTIASGSIKAPIPDAQILDSRYVNSFDQWAPK